MTDLEKLYDQLISQLVAPAGRDISGARFVDMLWKDYVLPAVEIGKRKENKKIVTEMYESWSALIKEGPTLYEVVTKFNEVIIMAYAIYAVMDQLAEQKEKDEKE